MNSIKIFPAATRMTHRAPDRADTSGAALTSGAWGYVAGIFLVLLLGLFQAQTARAAVAYVDQATATAAGTTNLSIARPGSTQAGDLMLATISTPVGSTISAPSGWTQIDQGDNDGNVTVAVFYKIAGTAAADAGPYAFGLTTNKEVAGAILTYSGVDATNPIDVSGALNSDGNTENPTAPCVTTSYDGDMVVRVFGQKDGKNDTPITAPAGTDKRIDLVEGDKILLGVADSTQTSAGETGTGVFAVSENKPARAATITLVADGAVRQSSIVFESSTTATAPAGDPDNTTSLIIDKPAGTVADDLLIAVVSVRGDYTISAQAGWTEFDRATDVSGNVSLGIFYRVVTAGDAGVSDYFFVIQEDHQEVAGTILRYSGVDVDTPIEGVSSVVDGKSDSPTAPDVTTTFDDTMIVRLYGQQAQGLSAPPDCAANRVMLNNNNQIQIGVADAPQLLAGATGTGAFFTDQDKDWRAGTLVLIPQQVKLDVTKTTSTPTVNAGDQASYSITVESIGGVTATGVVLSDLLPSGFTFDAVTSTVLGGGTTGPNPATNSGSATAPSFSGYTMPVGGTLTITYAVDVPAGTVGGVHTNTAAADSAETEPVTDSVDVTVLDADLAVTKTVDNPLPNEGDTITFTVVVANPSTNTSPNNGDATGVEVSDSLPSGLTYVSDTVTAGSYDSGTGVWTIGDLDNGASETLTITATVDSGQPDSTLLTNTASASADQNDPVAGNNTASATATSCPANHIHNITSVTTTSGDLDDSDNSDHVCTEVANRDFGDAPTSYGDASHRIPGTPTIYLGSVPPDAELTSQSNADAAGDDDTGTDDEDGVTFRSPAGTNQSISADVAVVTGGAPVTVCGWLDVPSSGGTVDGSFAESGDGSCPTIDADGTLTFQWSNLPQDQSYTTYARFRVCSTPAECNAPTGSATDGEAEDYRIEFDFRPTAATIGEVSLVAESVAEFLSGLGEDGGIDAMLALLAGFDPALAETLADSSSLEIRAALIAYLDPDGDGRVAFLRWETLQERGTVGFYVDRREGDIGNWERINGDMLPGLIAAPLGGEYLLADPEALPGETYQYQLIELEAWGTRRTYGPWTLSLPQ